MKIWLQKMLIFIGIAAFILLMFFATHYESKRNKAQIISRDLKLIASTLAKIHSDCEIDRFTQIKNPLTFFNVISFTGSEIGTLNLVNPEKWRGPYIKDNPSLQGVEYQVVQAHEGLFIVPGEGVSLPNGKIVGKDVIFDENSHIIDMLRNDDSLYYEQYKFAELITFKSNIIQKLSNASEQFFAD